MPTRALLLVDRSCLVAPSHALAVSRGLLRLLLCLDPQVEFTLRAFDSTSNDQDLARPYMKRSFQSLNDASFAKLSKDLTALAATSRSPSCLSLPRNPHQQLISALSASVIQAFVAYRPIGESHDAIVLVSACPASPDSLSLFDLQKLPQDLALAAQEHPLMWLDTAMLASCPFAPTQMQQVLAGLCDLVPLEHVLGRPAPSGEPCETAIVLPSRRAAVWLCPVDEPPPGLDMTQLVLTGGQLVRDRRHPIVGSLVFTLASAELGLAQCAEQGLVVEVLCGLTQLVLVPCGGDKACLLYCPRELEFARPQQQQPVSPLAPDSPRSPLIPPSTPLQQHPITPALFTPATPPALASLADWVRSRCASCTPVLALVDDFADQFPDADVLTLADVLYSANRAPHRVLEAAPALLVKLGGRKAEQSLRRMLVGLALATHNVKGYQGEFSSFGQFLRLALRPLCEKAENNKAMLKLIDNFLEDDENEGPPSPPPRPSSAKPAAESATAAAAAPPPPPPPPPPRNKRQFPTGKAMTHPRALNHFVMQHLVNPASIRLVAPRAPSPPQVIMPPPPTKRRKTALVVGRTPSLHVPETPGADMIHPMPPAVAKENGAKKRLFE